jgi:formate dehydrogenase subunit gamma
MRALGFGGRGMIGAILALVAALASAPALSQESGAKAQADRQSVQPLNNAPVWRDVRSGENPAQTTQVRGVETSVLIQTEGEIWRQVRNGPITVYGGWLLVLVFAALGLFYWVKGPLKLRERPTGRLIERFSDWERIVHWSTAISFVILAVTGLVTLFGKYVLLPLIGPTLFSWLATLGKALHNFVGPLFAVCTVVMFVTWVRDNLPTRADVAWVLKGGGLFTGEHVPSARFNAGQKSWFWIGVTVLGIVASVSGFILDFPNFDQGRLLMQQANVIHSITALMLIALALGHIYVGTIGIEGAYATMRTGYADEAWAKEHHEYWYNEVMARKEPAAGSSPSPAAAGPMKEGWKL